MPYLHRVIPINLGYPYLLMSSSADTNAVVTAAHAFLFVVVNSDQDAGGVRAKFCISRAVEGSIRTCKIQN
jgi:hypothetical protein